MRKFSIKTEGNNGVKIWNFSASNKEDAKNKALYFHKNSFKENGTVTMVMAF